MSTGNISDWYSLSDMAIVQELGKYLREERLLRNWTQRQVAEKTGLDRSTISQIENGRISNLLSFVQILRALEKLEGLSVFRTAVQISPMQMLRLEQQRRQRARPANPDTEQSGSSW